MRKLLVVAVALVSVVAAAATGIVLDTAHQFTFTDCSSGGSVAQTVPSGQYLVTSTDEDVWECLADSASTCAASGTRLPTGMAFLQTIGNGGRSVSCRSAGSTGDLQLTRVY